MPRKTSLGNILEANVGDDSAPAPSPPSPDATAAPPSSTTATRRHSISTELSSQPTLPAAASKTETATPTLFRSVREALASDASRVIEDPGGYTIITRRSSTDSVQMDGEQQEEVLHELDEAGYSVVRRRGSSSDGVSEMKSATMTTTTTTPATRRRQPRHHQSSHSPNPKGGATRATPSQQQQQQQQQSRRVNKKEPRHHGQQQHQQSWRRNASDTSTSNTNATSTSREKGSITTRERMERDARLLLPHDEPDPMDESAWLIPPPAPPVASLALPTSSSLLWTGTGTGVPVMPSAAQPRAPPAAEPMVQDEDPHLAWANAAKRAAAASSLDADEAAPPPQLETRDAAASPLLEAETMMSSWLGWDIAKKENPSDIEEL